MLWMRDITSITCPHLRSNPLFCVLQTQSHTAWVPLLFKRTKFCCAGFSKLSWRMWCHHILTPNSLVLTKLTWKSFCVWASQETYGVPHESVSDFVSPLLRQGRWHNAYWFLSNSFLRRRSLQKQGIRHATIASSRWCNSAYMTKIPRSHVWYLKHDLM